MTGKETYDHILKHMTAEEALLKLLEGHTRNYEHLKFVEGEEIHPLMVVSMAALDMGWDLAIPNGGEDDEVQGMAIGTPEYFEDLFSGDDSEGCDEGCESCDTGCSCDTEDIEPDDKFLEAVELLQYFVDRVEAGTIRSQTTYKKYKDYLAGLKQD